ncbi:NlpC/P60 family protein [Aliiroseovarius halocynthiae]|uniref:Peptidase n=1 Tax=Aliiroseovarius halocynthiae TaxID=985055 RepID=A0A545SWU2_9RHOB|nr:NlpC/P60 family protein [Aliiroseovarius halocynthiae]TQV69438.1 peptidase [Aliiroseovarius halocynthiae]
MGTTHALILNELQGWLGTPYVHQASRKGAGCDCLGLVRGVWRAVLGQEPAEVPPYTSDWSEADGQEALWQAATAHLRPKALENRQPGDILLFRMRSDAVAKHLGFLASTGPAPTFIHAYSGHGVVESPLSAPWARRIVACFEFPERTS